MVSTHSILTIAVLAFSSVSALPSEPRGIIDPAGVPSKRYLAFPLHATSKTRSVSLHKRQKQVPIANQIHGLTYNVNLTIGCSNQPVVLQLDTGSSEMWVNPDCSKVPNWGKGLVNDSELSAAQCLREPRYDPALSTTSVNLNETFSLTYGSGNVSGTYFTDDVTYAGGKIKQQQFGVAEQSAGIPTGILGVGPTKLVNAEPGKPGQIKYPGFINNLKSQGHISHIALSLDLRAVDQQGAVIFGGLDTKKYKDSLTKFPTENGGYYVPMTSVGQTISGQNSTTYPATTFNKSNSTNGVNVLLDSGAPFLVLPPALVLSIGNEYPGSSYDPSTRRFTVACQAPAGTIDFTFGANKTIHVPYSDFIFQDDAAKDESGAATCILGMMFGPPDFLVLGDSFMRAAYIVYDVDGKAIWLGEADDCGENIVAIGAKGVPVVEGCSSKSSY